MALNINRNVDDMFYRYKMPRLLAKVEGKGNGIKTVVVNMADVAKSLNRPPTYPTKFFGCELGAQTQWDQKNERYIVNGEHDQGKLQDILDGFIRKFVLCPACDNPETSLVVKRNQIHQSCKACGHANMIPLKHKLTTFIVKNPPPIDEADSAAGSKRKSKKSREGGGGSPSNDNENEVGMDFDTPLNMNGKHSSGDNSGDDGDYEPEDAPETDREQLTGAMAALAMNEDLDKPIEDRLDMFYNWLGKQKKAGPLNASVVVAEADRLDIKDKAVLLLCRSLFDAEVLQQIKDNQALLLRFTADNQKAQKYLIGGMEQLISGEHKAKLLPLTPIILKALYDADLVEEEMLIEWGKKPSKKFVASRKESAAIIEKAEPFLKWLEEADEESSSGEESDDEVEFDGPKQNGTTNGKSSSAEPDSDPATTQPTQNGIGKKAPPPVAGADDDSDAEDDLNIDDI